MNNPWQISIEALQKSLVTDLGRGLTAQEVNERLGKYGFNQLTEKKGPSALTIFLGQFNSPIVWILVAAALISGFLKEWLDAIAIVAIVIMNAIFGFIQEFRAEKAIAALKKLSAPGAKVIRDGELKLIPAKELVPGDVIQIEAGDHIPADGRLVQVAYFQTQEASLTGESVPIEKYSEELNFEEIPLAERKNMVYLGTQAVSGKAKAIVVNTGMNTELGKIAEMIEEAGKEETPLQKRLSRLGKWLVHFCLGIVVIIFFLGVIRGVPFIEMFLTAVSLAVAAIPEGLPAVVTIALAIGVQR
ncbi:MAG TPA: ATPase, partial [Elusimicrobia bacterium]|nr:ATPase [Elusimicrobiota bacterium]